MKNWTLKKCFTFITIAGMAFPAWASGGDDKLKMSEIYAIDAMHSYIGFSIKYMGYANIRGRFSEFKGALRYDEADLSKTSITLGVSIASLDTDLDWRDNDLKSELWLDAGKKPRLLPCLRIRRIIHLKALPTWSHSWARPSIRSAGVRLILVCLMPLDISPMSSSRLWSRAILKNA